MIVVQLIMHKLAGWWCSSHTVPATSMLRSDKRGKARVNQQLEVDVVALAISYPPCRLTEACRRPTTDCTVDGRKSIERQHSSRPTMSLTSVSSLRRTHRPRLGTGHHDGSLAAGRRCGLSLEDDTPLCVPDQWQWRKGKSGVSTGCSSHSRAGSCLSHGAVARWTPGLISLLPAKPASRCLP